MLSFVAVLLAILFLGMIYIAIDQENYILGVVAYCVMTMSFLIIVILSLYECFRDSSKKFIKFNKTVKEQLDLYFAQVNIMSESIGVEWSVMYGHYWIECKITKEVDRMRTTNT